MGAIRAEKDVGLVGLQLVGLDYFLLKVTHAGLLGIGCEGSLEDKFECFV